MARKRRSEQPEVRTGMPGVALTKAEFDERFRARFRDPVFNAESGAIERLAGLAHEAQVEDRKNPRTRPAGKGFADPSFPLSVEWLAAHRAVREAERAWKKRTGPARILVVNGSSRSDQTCPGET